MSKAHPGFKAVQSSIAKKEGISQDRAGAILASASRNASAAAKKANPRLNRVSGAAKHHFNDNGSHGTVTSIDMHHTGKHARVTVAHGRKKHPKGKDGMGMPAYDDRPTSTVLVSKKQAQGLTIGQRAGVGIMPLQNDADMDDSGAGGEALAPSRGGPPTTSAPKGATAKGGKKKGKKKAKAPKRPSRIAAAMGSDNDGDEY